MHIPQSAETDHLDAQLQAANVATEHLFRQVMESAGERFSTLRQMGKIAQVDRLRAVGAFTAAALALLDIELPNWKLRRVVLENDEWLCSLSRQPGVPIEFDDTAEARHTVLSLALLRALLAARLRNGTELISLPSDTQIGPSTLFCCDNFS